MKCEKIFKSSDVALKKALGVSLINKGYKIHNEKKFLYAEGNAPYMLVAHLDTVHKQPPSIICYSKDGNYMMSPQGIGGDDRCGVYIILELLKRLPFKPYVLFTMDEEIGGLGANAFVDYISTVNIPKFKYIVEYDRKGDKDCVSYGCGNEVFVEFVEKFGFKEAYGTFSDISKIAPALGVAAVNLSSGYYNPHTNYEYVSIKDMHETINASVKMLCTECEGFEYVEKYKNYLIYQKKVWVTFLPKGTMYVCADYEKQYYINNEWEIAVDEYGKIYRFDATYEDLTPIHKFFPVKEDFVPKYDIKNSLPLPVFDWSY